VPAPTPTLKDADARRRIETELEVSFLVEAAAGTGKTTQLVRRLVAVLEGTPADDEPRRSVVDRVVAVTFTRKAAGELKLRLRQVLDECRAVAADELARARLEDAIARLEEAHVGTIHGFCAEILRQRPVEAGIDPAFTEIDEEESARLYERAFRSWVERRLADMPEGLRRALSRLAGQRSAEGKSPLDRLCDAGRTLVDWRDFPAPFERRPFDREEQIDRLVVRLEGLARYVRASSNRRDYLHRAIRPADDLWAWLQATEAVSDPPRRDYDELEARLIGLLRSLKRSRGWKGRGPWFAAGVPRDEVQRARDRMIAELEAFERAANADLAALLQRELLRVVERYEELKQRTGQLDFLDLLLATRDLLRDRPEVRRVLQRRFTHLFVDELQDTDPLQAEILLLLAADDPEVDDWRRVRPVPGKLFLVGDPKQSIYRFRRADVRLYQSLKDQLEAAGVEVVLLTSSFRSLPALQAAVNAAFAPEMSGDRASGQPSYVPLEPVRAGGGEQPALVVLPAPSPYGYSRITGFQIDACLPAAVAAWIAWLVNDSGWTIEDPESRRQVPIAPRHVAVLFRRFLTWGRDVTQPYVRELEARGVPHLLVGGRSFFQREEIETLRAALTAVEWPDDELAVFATLKGALFAIPDRLLLRYRTEVGPLHPIAAAGDVPAELVPIADALAFLRRLHRRRNLVPIAETLHQLLAETRAHAGFALWPAGNQVLANVQRIRDLARAFEMRGGLSFRGFVERLAKEAEAPGASHAPVLEEGADGVRLMTVHAAKGLEFPVVVLADLTARLTPVEAGRHIDVDRRLVAERLLGWAPWELIEHAELELERERAEGVRLAYVAATRARDLLAVTAVGDEPFETSWLAPLYKAIYPPPENRRWSRPAPGCPPFGDRTVLDRPQEMGGGAERSVRPGLHRPESGGPEVVWWDAELLARRVQARLGIQQENILSPRDEDAADAGRRRFRRWQTMRDDALEAGESPSRTVVAVSDAGEPEDLYLLDLRVEILPRPAGRPHGRRFGTLVHTVLRDVDLVAGEGDVAALARFHGRVLQAPEAEIEAAAQAVSAALAHPLLRQAAAAERVLRETPFLVGDERGRLLEGTIDLAFPEDGGWLVVDFKTDAGVRRLEERYRQQLAWYVKALARLSGRSARGVLLGV